MVWSLVPSSATAKVFEGSTLAVVEGLTATDLERASSKHREGRKRIRVVLWGYLSTSQRLTSGASGLSYPLFEGRNRPVHRHRFCVVAENKAVPVFSFDLFDLTGKSLNAFITPGKGPHTYPWHASSNRDSSTASDTDVVNECLQSSKVKPHFKATVRALDACKHQISVPSLKQRVWKTLVNGSKSLDATPLAPLPPFTGGLITLLGFVLVLGVVLDRWIGRASRGLQLTNVNDAQVKTSGQPKAPTGISVFLERDLKKKESVEWVNMVLGKLWKIYRLGLESWLVGLLQPLIDNLQKPGYVDRVQIKQFYLGDEPISVRSVERRASRRVNDLQYHIGLRYTGGARMLLLLKLRAGFIPISIPVGVRGLDVDGELWVKLRLVPSEPWVGTATWAFVSLPKIKLDLSPFRLFNLMAIPFLSVFLTKLLTQDLPRLFVRPNKNVIDFLKGKAVGPVPKDFKGATIEGNKDFAGELSVTLVDARKLNYVPYGKTDPYVVLILGDQVIRSKKNSQTSVVGPPGGPIWNQDFQLLVVDPKTQRLAVRVRDYFGLTAFTVGAGEVELSALRDTVPTDRVVRLTGGRGPFQKRFAGEVLLRLTYTAYVEDEEEERRRDEPLSPTSSGYSSEMEERADAAIPLVNEVVNKAVETVQDGKISIPDMFAAVIADLNDGEGLQEGSEISSWVASDDEGSVANLASGTVKDENSVNGATTGQGELERAKNEGRAILLLGMLTGIALLVAFSLNFSNLMNP